MNNNRPGNFEADPDRLIREIKERYQRFIKGGGGKPPKLGFPIGGLLVVLFLIIAVWGSFYTVEPNEEAVVLRFGKYINSQPPGLHFKLPFGVDDIIKVKTKLIFQQEFGFRTQSMSGARTTYSEKNLDDESLMLTGDLNVAEVEWIVQYQISDPMKYLFQSNDPEKNIRDVSEAIMRRVVGDKLVMDVLTTGRSEIATGSKTLMQEVFDHYDMGVSVVTVELQDVNPPDAVKASFNEVNAAKQEQEKAINTAEREYNKVIPEARGKAEEVIAQAQGYSEALVNQAKGDALKFERMLKEYLKARQVTRDRLYLETMQEVMGRFKKLVVVDSKIKGLLPIYQKQSKLGE